MARSLPTRRAERAVLARQAEIAWLHPASISVLAVDFRGLAVAGLAQPPAVASPQSFPARLWRGTTIGRRGSERSIDEPEPDAGAVFERRFA